MKPRRIIPYALSISLALVLLSLVTDSGAHTLPLSFLRLSPDADYLHLELTFNPFELTFFSELDANRDGRLDSPEWEAEPFQATRRMVDGLEVSVDGNPVSAEVAGIVTGFDSHHATLRAHYAVDARRGAVTVVSSLAELTSGSHFTQVTFVREGGAQSARLDARSVAATFGEATGAAVFSEQNGNLSANAFAPTAVQAHLGGTASEQGAPANQAFPTEDRSLAARFVSAVLLTLGVLLGLVWLLDRANPRSTRTFQAQTHQTEIESRRTQ